METPGKSSYFESARERSRRRRSPWNLLLIPACLGAFAAIYWAYLAFADWVVNQLFPRDAYFRTFSTLGGIFRYIPAGFLVLALSFAVGNQLVYCIPSARRALGTEAEGHPETSFDMAQKGLFKGFLLLLPFCLPLCAAGVVANIVLTDDGVFIRSVFSPVLRRYDWKDISSIKTSCWAKRGAIERSYLLVFKDGNEADLAFSHPRNFIEAFPRIQHCLQGHSFSFVADTDGNCARMLRCASTSILRSPQSRCRIFLQDPRDEAAPNAVP
jgi:hypothetical protein